MVVSKGMKRKRSTSTVINTPNKKTKITVTAPRTVTKKKVKDEVKMLDQVRTSSPVGLTALRDPLCNIDQGIEKDQRIGQEIAPTKLNIRCHMVLNGAANSQIRIIVLQDKQQVSGVVTPIADVLEAPTNYLSFINQTFINRYNIIHDHVYDLVQGSSDAITVSISSKKLLPIRYAAPGSTTYSQNGLFMIQLSNSNTNPPNILWYSRLKYMDK